MCIRDRNDYPILNIFIRFGDIRRRTSKSSEIGPHFACFWLLKFFWVACPKILDRRYKIGPSTDHPAKFHAGRPTHLEISRWQKKLEIWGKAQRESARRFKSDWMEIRSGVKFPCHQSHVPWTQMHWHMPNAYCRFRVGQHERRNIIFRNIWLRVGRHEP